MPWGATSKRTVMTQVGADPGAPESPGQDVAGQGVFWSWGVPALGRDPLIVGGC